MMNNKGLTQYYKIKYLDECAKFDIENLIDIKEQSKRYNINPELVFGIITLEKMSRGDLLTRIIEKLIFYLCPFYLIKINASLGIGQVRILTAIRVLEGIGNYEALKLLMKPRSNIEIVSKLLYKYHCEVSNKESNNIEVIKCISNLYITGHQNPKENLQTDMHSLLLTWSINNQLFKESFDKN